MKIKVVTGQSLFHASVNLIENIDVSDFNVQNYVLVPDRFSLQIENLIMQTKDLEATFNIEVLGLSRLATRILKELGVKGDTLTSDECLLLTEQAIENVKHGFKSFKKNSVNFAQEVSKVISQFKSSGLKSQDIVAKCSQISVQNKYHDLALIYEEYQKLIEGRFDANKLLEFFGDLVLQSDILKDVNIYLVGFDSFTSEMFGIISNLAKSAKGVFIALPKANTLGNSYIYEDDILNKLKTLCQQENIMIEVEEKLFKVNAKQDAIINNLYSDSVATIGNQNFFMPIACQSLLQEVMTVGKIINAYIRQGGRYNDIAIACSNLEKYKPYLDRCFALLDIPFFADVSVKADKLVLPIYISKFFNVVLSGFSNESLLDYFSSGFYQNDNKQEIIRLIINKALRGKSKAFKYLSVFAPKDINFFEKLCSCNTCLDFCNAIKEFVEFYKDSYLSLLENLQQNYTFEYRLNLQAEEYVTEALESILKYQANYEISLNEFAKKMQLLLSFNEVSTVPTYVDSIFVGDATSSYFVECKNLFVLGGGEVLPRVVQDNGLVSDNDIERVGFVRALEPSIRMINRRNRFKLFNLLTLAQEKLFVTFRTNNDDGKRTETPNFVENLCQIYGAKPTLANFLFKGFEDDTNFVYGLGSKKNALIEYAGTGLEYDNRQMASLKACLNFEESKLYFQREKLDGDMSRLFFPKDYTKVTQLECYFSCPFKHFVRYGLKLKENSLQELSPMDIGNICHRIAQLFVLEKVDSLGKLTQKQITQFASNNLQNVLQELGLQDLIEGADEKETLISYILWQVELVLERINYEQKNSSFKPKFVEKNLEGLSIQIENSLKEMKVVGKVDRVDVCGDYFRIIDYKTGSVNPLIKDLYYGDKLQLFVYQKGIANMLQLSCGGVFYFDCKFDFYEQENGALLKGLVKEDDDVIACCDNRLGVQEKSDLIGVSTRKVVKDGISYKGNSICKIDLQILQEYALRVSAKALSEIQDGYILPKPDEDACSKCAYKGICLYDACQGVRKKARVTESDIEKIVKGGQDG